MTFIAAYHYIRIFNSWVDSYEYHAGKPDQYGALFIEAPTLTGVPFNDAYRYMDWLLTVPLLLIEILLVMKLPDDVFSAKAALSQALLKNVQKLRKDAGVAEGPPLWRFGATTLLNQGAPQWNVLFSHGCNNF